MAASTCDVVRFAHPSLAAAASGRAVFIDTRAMKRRQNQPMRRAALMGVWAAGPVARSTLAA